MSLTCRLLNNIKTVCSWYAKDQFAVRRLGSFTSPNIGLTLPRAALSVHIQYKSALELPYSHQSPLPLQLPNGYAIVMPQTPLLDWIPNIFDERNTITEPENETLNSPMQAARLIVIRRKKMKKHKLKKFRKRTKYEHAKVKQRRELKKEKEFHALLITRCKEAEAFSAEEYVKGRIKEATAKPPPRFRDTELYKELMRRKNLYLDTNPKI